MPATRIRARFLRRLAGLIVVLSVATQASAEPLYLATNGVLAIEAEAIADVPADWDLVVSGRTEGFLQANTDSFNLPGEGTIGYAFRAESSGPYQFAMRSRIGIGNNNTEHNDVWVRLLSARGGALSPISNDNVGADGRWHKAYMNFAGGWSHNASNKDNDPHSLAWNLSAGSEYTLQISSRSRGHQIDRLFLWNRDRYNLANQVTGGGSNNSGFQSIANSPDLNAIPEPASLALLATTVCLASWRRGTHA